MLDRLETTLRIRGGARLEGSVATHGAKNAALPIMAAALLAKGTVTLHRIPRITDVSVMWSLLEALGARIRYEGDNTVTIDASNVASYRAPYALVRKLAASFDVVGALLGRFGRAEVPLPGGCVLGTRATDMHEQAFVALGCDVHNAHGYLIAQSRSARLAGRDDRVSHAERRRDEERDARRRAGRRHDDAEKRRDGTGGRRSGGLSRCDGSEDQAAREPIRSSSRACDELHGVEYEIIPDRIVAGTLLVAGAVTRGDVTVTRCRPDHLGALLDKLVECGVVTMTGDDWIRAKADGITGGTDILTAPYPGFPTDLQPQMVGFLCTCPGTSVVEESIFNARFSYVNELARMGADVKVTMESNAAVIKGPKQLSGAPVEAPDIRAGAGLVVAGLAAAGETEIIGLEYVDRGYERLEELLSELGGQVQRSSGVTPLVEPTGFFETSEYPRVSATG